MFIEKFVLVVLAIMLVFAITPLTLNIPHMSHQTAEVIGSGLGLGALALAVVLTIVEGGGKDDEK